MATDTTTQTQIIKQAPFLEEFQRKLLDVAFARGQTPTTIPSVEVAGLDPLTQQALQTGQGIGQFQPFLQTGAGTIAGGLAGLQQQLPVAQQSFLDAAQAAQATGAAFDPATQVAPFMDPFQQLVTQDAVREMARQASFQQNQLGAQAAATGALGGSREGIAQQELNRNLLDLQSRRIFEDLSRNFNQAQNASQTAFENQQKRQQNISQLLSGIGQGQAQTGILGAQGIGQFGAQQLGIAGTGQGLIGQQAQLQSQLGALGQTQAQRILDAARQTEMQRTFEPFQRVGFMSDIFKPQIGSGMSTLQATTAPSPSLLSQGIGAGIAGLGLNQAFGNPLGNFLGFGKKAGTP
jgi:hypothetical protein